VTAPETLPRRDAARWLLPLAVAVITVVAFAPALRAGFVTWDDDTNFIRNPDYRGLAWENLRWMWSTFLLGHYVPLAWMTLGLDHVLWGMDARGYHATNLVIHAANAVLLYMVACRLLPMTSGITPRQARWPAALGALLYSVHPLRAESAVWITERRDVLSSFFFLAAVLAYLRAAREGASRRWYWATVALFAAALLSKATAVTLPVVLLILAVYPLRRFRLAEWRGAAAGRVYRELAPLAAMSAAIGVLSIVALNPGRQLAPLEKIAVSAWSFFFYLWKTLIPTGLAALYEMPSSIHAGAPRYLAGYGAFAAFVALVVVSARRWPGVAAALAAFFVMLLPLLGVVQNGVQIAADRYTYQAMQPVAVLAAALLARWWRRPVIAAALAAVLVLAGASWRQAGYWKDSETLWKRVLAVDSTSSLAHPALANVLLAEGRLDEAIAHYRASLAINPRSLEVDNNLGIALGRQGKFDEAAAHYRRAIEIKPDHYEARNNLGAILARDGDAAAAIEQFQKALAIRPDFPDAEVNWGNALLRSGKAAEAIGHYRRAIKIRPGNADAEHNWGVALAQQGRFADAIVHLRRAVALNPSDPVARQNLEAAERALRERGS
jgi:tetratricopeptide (TPR) repeat protein